MPELPLPFCFGFQELPEPKRLFAAAGIPAAVLQATEVAAAAGILVAVLQATEVAAAAGIPVAVPRTTGTVAARLLVPVWLFSLLLSDTKVRPY